jgi:hypothetical protein
LTRFVAPEHAGGDRVGFDSIGAPRKCLLDNKAQKGPVSARRVECAAGEDLL